MIDKETAKRIWHSDLTWGIATLGALMVLYGRIDANAQAKVDTLKNEMIEFKGEYHNGMNRVDVKVDALLLALRIPNPAPAPITKDGGQ